MISKLGSFIFNRGVAATLVLCLLLSALGAWAVAGLNERKAYKAVAFEAGEWADALVSRVEIYQYGLRGVRGAVLTAGEHGIDREAFHRYSLTRDLNVEFPGARGFGFIRRVSEQNEADFLNLARRDGRSDFTIRQISPHKGERYVIQYIEPVEPNRLAIGLDIASESARRDAAYAAMQSGEVRLTAPVTLVQNSGKPLQAVLILLPIYRDAVTPSSIAERNAAAFGWSFAPLLMDEVLGELSIEGESLHVTLRDVTASGQETVLYSSGDDAANEPQLYTKRLERNVFGRHWQIDISAHPAFLQRLNLVSPHLVMTLGALASLILAAFVGSLGASRQQQQKNVTAQAQMAAIVESSADGIIGKTLQGVITSWNKGAEQIFGYPAQYAVGRPLIDLLVPKDLAAEEMDILARIQRGERVPHFDTRRVHQNGSLIDVSVTVSPIRDAAGEVIGASKTVRDISVQKAYAERILELNSSLEQQVSARTAELEKLNVLLGNVLHSASEVAIIATDLEGVIRVFNHGAERLLGYRDDEVLGKSTPMPFHLEKEVQARGAELSADYGYRIEGFRIFAHVPETEGSETREWTFLRKDGSRFIGSLVATAMRDQSGQLVGFLGIAVDITQRKTAEEARAASLEMTRAILDTAMNPIISIDAAGKVMSFNPAGEAVFGYSLEEMTGRNLKELMPQPWREANDLQHLLGNARTGTGKSREMTWLRKDGTTFPAQVSIGSMRLAGQNMFVCIITDISMQQKQRSELTAARDQLLLAAEAAELGIWAWDLQADELHWNDRMFELYGLPLALRDNGLSYQHWLDRIHPDDAAKTTGRLEALVERGETYVPIFRAVLPDGQVRFIQAGARVQRAADGTAIHVTGINLDVTAQRELESRLLYAKEQADAASAAKSSFLANMSHEIRTPMNAVLGMLQLVQRTGLNPRQLDYVSKAETAAKSLLVLLNDILDYSKIEAGKLQLDLFPFDLESLMQDLSIVLAGNQGQKDVEVMFDLDPDLPSTLVGDSHRLQQVLINLAGNALKFTHQGQVIVRVKLLSRLDAAVCLRIEVIDSGIGISSEQQGRIFEGFNQAEASTTRRFGGTGLGLVICKRLVTMMGGDLQVESELGEGSRFWFDLILDIDHSHSLRSECAYIDQPLRLLVADDNQMAAEVLVRTVKALGWHADSVSGGIEAVKQVNDAFERNERYDVVLMDWRMPDLDGLSAAHQINLQQGDKGPPMVIMITAFGREALADVHEKDTSPFVDYLTKPVTPKQLAKSIQQAFEGKGSVQPPSLQIERPKRLAGLCLLVVEDNALNRQVASELLSAEGAEVHLAEGGLEGVNQVINAEKPFDIVLMDIQMPDMDGLEATRRIRSDARFADLPIVAMTANASEDDRKACLKAGMNEHVGKPIDIEQLVFVLRAQLASEQLSTHSEGPSDNGEGILEAQESILRRFGGNLDLIRNVLSNFSQELGGLLGQLETHIAAQDPLAAAAALHAVKGSAASAGAKALANLAGEFETVLRQIDAQREMAYLSQTGIAELKHLLAESAQELRDLFGEERATVASTTVEEILTPAEWAGRLRELLSLLQSGSLRAVEVSQRLSLQTPVSQRVRFGQAVQNIQVLDFPAAMALVREMLE